MSMCDHICRECGQVMNCQHCKPYRLPADRARITELEAALAFYADPDNYLKRGISSVIEPLAIVEGGDLARSVVPNWENISPAAAVINE